jgi:RhtB (resistance to homoserine/threonine) family protein
MLTQFFTIGLLTLFSAMLPGPDFAIVTRNTIAYSRRSGLYTSLGIASGVLVHVTYCVWGVAIVILNSLTLFSIIKYVGAGYLVYLGVNSLRSPLPARPITDRQVMARTAALPRLASFRQGFVCNLFNPKATLFFLALFTMIIDPATPPVWSVIYVVEIFFIVSAWFCCLTFILSHPSMVNLITKSEKYIAKLLGLFLIGFGIILAFARQ